MPAVRADEDDDDEEQLHDPQVGIRANCRKKEKAVAIYNKFQECNTRVRSKKKTRETCEEEYHDFIHFLDHCTAEELFNFLK